MRTRSPAGLSRLSLLGAFLVVRGTGYSYWAQRGSGEPGIEGVIQNIRALSAQTLYLPASANTGCTAALLW